MTKLVVGIVVASSFLDSAEFVESYGENVTDDKFMTTI